jgi:hypothetical protein
MLTQDNKSTSTMTQDNRTAAAMLTQDNKTIGSNLWTSAMFPWTLDFPWSWNATGVLITSDPRH